MPFELILLLLFIFWPLISRLLEKNKPRPEGPVEMPPELDESARQRPHMQRRQQQRPQQGQPSRPHWEPDEPEVVEAEADSLAEALRQIREALGQPEARPEPAAPPPPPPPAPPRPRAQPQSRAQPQPRPQPQSRPGPKPVTQTPPATETIYAGAIQKQHPQGRLEVSKLGPTRRATSPLARMLATKGAAQQAVIMKEILDAPPSRRYRVRRPRSQGGQ